MSASPVAPSRDAGVREAHAMDASGLRLVPDAVARPTDEREVAELLARATADGVPVTAAGGQTSTTGASITDRGILLSLRALARVGEVDERARTIRAQAGALVADVKRVAAARGLLFPPDPTSEGEATIGGAVACNASGARSLRYGATRAHVVALRVALADGEVIELRRPRLEKNTVGYALAHDPVDWFIGSEGTLGVVLEAELALLPAPASVTGLLLPFPDERRALAFVADAREAPRLRARCLEYFDAGALAIARDAHGGGWAPGAGALVYAEDAGDDDAPPALEAWLALAERHEAWCDDVTVLASESELREARRVRHAVPATMNERGAARRTAGGRKVSTDWAVPYRRLGEAIAHARAIARDAGVDSGVIYGHAGNGHPHQNFIARDGAELARVERVVEETLRRVIAMGGTVAAEHGIGKLKRRWLPLQMTERQIRVMRAIKRELDPAGILAPGNVLP
ncbi:MAG TPA: FAD-binding oxidoreductase [Gemmatimonadaceae bacterium]